jgi:hypothetical protein
LTTIFLASQKLVGELGGVVTDEAPLPEGLAAQLVILGLLEPGQECN